MRIFVLAFVWFVNIFSLIGQSPALNWSSYGEFYFGMDDLRSKSHNRPGFLYNHTRNEEIALNLAFARCELTDSLWRAKGGLMAGNYVEKNLSGEPSSLRNIYEATIGFRLQKAHDLWLEAGIFPSHIGYETVVSNDNPTLTRSLIAENSPYYESGVKLTGFSRNKKWSYLIAMINGWQRISRVGGYYPPSIGCQIKFEPNTTWTVSYSNYLGDESSDEDLALRQFHDLNIRFKTKNNVMVIAGLDVGQQPDLKSEDWTPTSWYGGSLMFSVPIQNGWSLNARLEKYVDSHEVVVNNPFDNGFELNGYSAGLDYKINEYGLLRLEGKRFDGPKFTFLEEEERISNVTHMIHVALTLYIP
jgi:Putative beta-barrel porin-2, OmpL-like. bbp2